jgi:hypothetical protein
MTASTGAHEDPSHPGDLHFDTAADRLRARAVWAAPLVALGSALPYEVVDGHPQFLWHLAGELPPAGVAAILAPAVAALTVGAARWRSTSAAGLAWATLGALAGAGLVIALGRDAAAWEPLPLPDSLATRPGGGLVALALSAAGANLTFARHTRRLGRRLLVAALFLATAFYLLPGRGEAPLRTVVRLLGEIESLPGWRFALGAIVLSVMALWPGVVALFGQLHHRHPATDPQPVLGIVAIYGLPLLLVMLAVRVLPTSPPPWTVFAIAGGVAVLAGLLALLSAAVEVGLAAVWAPADPKDLTARGSARRAVVAVALAGAAQWGLARPPAKGLADWQPAPPTAAADTLFADVLPAWSEARLVWDHGVRVQAGAAATVEVKRAARDARRAAAALDPGVGHAIDALTRRAHDLDLAGREWSRLVGDVNAAIRAAGQPYYLDPSALVLQSPDGLRRHFRMRAYRVHHVRRFATDDAQYATLHVARLDDPDARDILLGFSRDRQPFALVLLPEIDALETQLRADIETGRCTFDGGFLDPRVAARCGGVLAAALTTDTLHRAVVSNIERHELQHQIDGPHLPMPGPVLAHTARLAPSIRARINRELSAYIAELTADDAPAALGLVHLLRFLDGPAGVEHHVALLALSLLADRPLPPRDDAAARAHAVDGFAALADLEDGTLRSRAASAWAELYGAPLAAPRPLQPAAPAGRSTAPTRGRETARLRRSRASGTMTE